MKHKEVPLRPKPNVTQSQFDSKQIEGSAGFRRTAGWACLIVAALMTVFMRLANIDMTETRLFIEFWYFWMLIGALCFMGYKWIESAK